MTETTKNTTSRRAVTQGLAWSVPAVAAASAAPAMAATTPADPLYRYQVAVGGRARLATSGCGVSRIDLSTQDPFSGANDGFGIYEMAGVESPATMATVEGPLDLVFALPAGLFLDQADPTTAFRIVEGNYAPPEVDTVTMTNPITGATEDYYVFVYCYQGSLTQPTGAPGSGDTFDGSALRLTTNDMKIDPNYCVNPDGTLELRTGFFAGGYQGDWTQTGSFTTETGYTGDIDFPIDSNYPDNPESWITLGQR